MQENNVEKAAEFRSSDLKIGPVGDFCAIFLRKKQLRKWVWALVGWFKAKLTFKLDTNWGERRRVSAQLFFFSFFFICNFGATVKSEERERERGKMFDNQKCFRGMRDWEGVGELVNWT